MRAHPIPSAPYWELHIGRYVSIITSELCGFLFGTIVLVRNTPLRWQETSRTVLVALALSYVLGVAIWTVGFLGGILVSSPVSNPANPFPLLNPSLPLIGLTVLLIPEFIGTAVGTMIIRMRLKVSWKRALASMTVAMLINFSINMLIVSLALP